MTIKTMDSAKFIHDISPGLGARINSMYDGNFSCFNHRANQPRQTKGKALQIINDSDLFTMCKDIFNVQCCWSVLKSNCHKSKLNDVHKYLQK